LGRSIDIVPHAKLSLYAGFGGALCGRLGVGIAATDRRDAIEAKRRPAPDRTAGPQIVMMTSVGWHAETISMIFNCCTVKVVAGAFSPASRSDRSNFPSPERIAASTAERKQTEPALAKAVEIG
jgi:hypothetical protein